MAVSTNEFSSLGPLRDRIVCYKHDVKAAVLDLARRALGKSKPPVHVKSRFSSRKAKELVLRERLAVADGKPSWFYTAFERGDADPLTNYALDFIDKQVPHSGRVLVTGCGTGITAFHLADCGFREVVGVDLLPEAIAVANRIKDECKYNQTSFYVTDGFKPQLTGSFDVITLMHWVFSAWMGNYGNDALQIDRARDPAVRERLLTELLAAYVPHLNRDGIIIVELTDAVADYRLPADHKFGDRSTGIYPVRQTPEQVERCARQLGLEIIDRKLCLSYGHQPRTAYYLKKS